MMFMSSHFFCFFFFFSSRRRHTRLQGDWSSDVCSSDLILTQTLQYIDDIDAALRECRRILKPGGVLLATVPCLGKVEGLEKNVAGNFWRFTDHACRYCFAKHFPPTDLQIKTWGNALTGMAFWIGLAQEDLPRRH